MWPARFLVPLLLLVASPIAAQTTLTGVVERVTPESVTLSSGQAYRRSPAATVTLAGDKEGRWASLQAGDRVRLAVNSQNRVLSVTVTGRLVTKRIERSLTELQPVEGAWKTNKDVTIAGRLFEAAGIMNTENNAGGKAVFPNRERYDLLEAWIGTRGGSPESNQFAVLGDGEVLYTSPVLRPDDPAVKISIPISGYGAVTLVARAPRNVDNNYYDTAVWADPVLVKLPSAVPALVSPGLNERVSGSTPLVWKGVDGARGYLLELQCERLNSAGDAKDKNRFLAVPLPAGTTVYTFNADALPRGKWRWRVHALSSTGFLGQMDGWRSFVSE